MNGMTEIGSKGRSANGKQVYVRKFRNVKDLLSCMDESCGTLSCRGCLEARMSMGASR